ncbi:MarR family winged helix-turn-helix transcriptional regulator [Rathayibacter sp. SD072]|uniref:MarR family winged helix-turn-helix transcriptional regulator n=1 Tax=Rathayibacter sp. SD072 TaxID=2781731 RepID=UPI001A97D084|nr:MarR family transcriptional regulator [Rathayibacter sp. SD072]MBO0985744.1 MarR family transcriptional regulator [Rathayibacter sp. SD072]
MTPTPTPPDGEAGITSVAHLRHALRLLETAQRQLRSSIASEIGVGLSELTALETISDLTGLTPKMLGLELGLTTGAVTALLDRLAASGHVDRLPNPRDRRSVLLGLTDSGAALLSRVEERYDAVSAEVLRASPRLGEEDMAEELARAAAVITAHTIR